MREIYFDNAASTRVDRDVAELAFRLMTEDYGNSSSLHDKGRTAERLLSRARGQLAAALGAEEKEIVFCSGGTEANNLALLGAAGALRRRGGTIVTTTVEHASVLETCAHLEREGFTVRRVPPLPDGSVDTEAVLAAVDDDTILVSCVAVNSEAGAVTDVRSLAEAVYRRRPEAAFHTDAVQLFGKLPFSVRGSKIGLVSVSAHKLHAPKGVAALYIRQGVRVLPILHGGGHQNGLRAGTENSPLCCAFGMAAERASAGLQKNLAHVSALSLYFRERVANLEGICINSPAEGTPYIQNISAPGYLSAHLINRFSERGIFVAGGSACSGGKPSRILAEMGLPRERIEGALRVSFCRENTVDEIDAFFDELTLALRETAHR